MATRGSARLLSKTTRFGPRSGVANTFASSFGGPTVAFIGSHTYNGWFLGGGTEIALSGLFGLPLPPGLFWRSEYRYSSFNSANLPIILTPGGAVFGFENTKPYVQTVTSALVYRFGWLGR